MISERQCQRYCYEPLELIENFYMAVSSPERWDCHHRVETIMNCGSKELIAQGCYYDRPAHELVFLPHSEHTKLHRLGNKTWLGRHHSEETKEKCRRANLGNKICLGRRLSEETKEKLRRANSGTNSPIYGMHWWNNGEISAMRKECPGAGWRRGRLRTGA